MRKLSASTAALVLLALAATPASACAVGIDRLLFEKRPVPVGLDEAEVVFGHFTNEGDAFSYFDTRFATLRYEQGPKRLLVGVVRMGSRAERVPVYAFVNSCTHGFYGQPVTPHNGDFYLIGRWLLLPDGSRAFRAGGVMDSGEGDLLKHWHY
jgi:hypothetical protein